MQLEPQGATPNTPQALAHDAVALGFLYVSHPSLHLTAFKLSEILRVQKGQIN